MLKKTTTHNSPTGPPNFDQKVSLETDLLNLTHTRTQSVLSQNLSIEEPEELLEMALVEIGGFGRLQWLANVILACGWLSTSMWWSNIPTLLLEPKYLCLYIGESAT